MKEKQVCKLVAFKPTNLSKAMHSAAFEALELKFCYELLDTDNTAEAIAEMRELGTRGYSLTIPHKEQALGLLDEVSSDVREIGAVNTVVNCEGGVLRGFNTDWTGIIRSIEEAGLELKEKRVVMLGAGGAARAGAYALKELGVKDVVVANRTVSRAKEVAKDFGFKGVSFEELTAEHLNSCKLLINATPLGSHLAESQGMFFKQCLEGLSKDGTVFDMVTKEETELLNLSNSMGLETISGLRMLLHQAVEQFKLFTDSGEEPVAIMEKALYQEASRS